MIWFFEHNLICFNKYDKINAWMNHHSWRNWHGMFPFHFVTICTTSQLAQLHYIKTKHKKSMLNKMYCGWLVIFRMSREIYIVYMTESLRKWQRKKFGSRMKIAKLYFHEIFYVYICAIVQCHSLKMVSSHAGDWHLDWFQLSVRALPSCVYKSKVILIVCTVCCNRQKNIRFHSSFPRQGGRSVGKY